MDAQSGKISSEVIFARQQVRLEMIKILRAAPVMARILELQLMLNQVGIIFKADEEAPGENDTVQAA